MRRITLTGRLRAACAGRTLRVGAIALGAIAAGPVLLAACGNVPAPGSGAAPAASTSSGTSGSPAATATPGAGSAAVALCQQAASITGLRIVRVPAGHVPQEQAVFPNLVAVASPAHAREVARALCALPAMPRGIYSCPALFPGTTYELTFTADGRRFAPVTIDATGCETVTGVGPVRRALDPGFWRVLSVAAGVIPPGQPAFARPDCTPPETGMKINGCPGLMQPGGAAQGSSAGVS
jgi:hypothetical protein